MKLQNFIKTGIVFALLLFLAACGDDDLKQNNQKTIRAEYIVVEESDKSNKVFFAGNIEGIERVKLSTKLMGNITYMPYEVGKPIKKGQVLAKISSKDLLAKKEQVRANITQAEAALKNMEINYDRVKSLFDKGSATQKELEDITMAYDMTKAQVKAAKEMENEIKDVLSYSVIKAPFDGYIVNKFYESGDLTAPGHPLFIVENYNGFKLKSQVSAKDINKFAIGDSVEVLIDELNNKAFNGVISAVNAGAHPATRQFEVIVEIEANSESGIKSGMYGKIAYINDSEKIVSVDKNLLVKKGQLTGVYTLGVNNNVLLRWIRTGKEIDNKVEVLSGLNIGDKVITDIKGVSEGQIVEVK